MTLVEFLRTLAEDIPQWLSSMRPGGRFDREAFLSSRVVVYPGSGNDGHAVRTFGKAGAAHCFLHIDYLVSEAEIRRRLNDPMEGFRGYAPSIVIDVTEEELSPSGWIPHIRPGRHDRLPSYGGVVAPYALLVILDRLDGFGPEHGPSRLAVLFLAGDGHASFDALFAQRDSRGAPFAMVLEDHGFGGDYSRWGAGGVTHQIATNQGVFPRFLLVANGTAAWPSYQPVPEVAADPGGRWRNPRRLYER